MHTDSEVRIKGMRALLTALDPTDTGRFLSLHGCRIVDYTEIRHLLFEGMSIEEISEAAKLGEKRHQDEETES